MTDFSDKLSIDYPGTFTIHVRDKNLPLIEVQVVRTMQVISAGAITRIGGPQKPVPRVT